MIRLILSLLAGVMLTTGAYAAAADDKKDEKNNATEKKMPGGNDRSDFFIKGNGGSELNFSAENDNTLILILCIAGIAVGVVSSLLAFLVLKKLSAHTIKFQSGKIKNNIDIFNALEKLLSREVASGTAVKSDDNSSAMISSNISLIKQELSRVSEGVSSIKNDVANQLVQNLNQLAVNLEAKLTAIRTGSQADMQNYVDNMNNVFSAETVNGLRECVAAIRDNLEKLRQQQPELANCMIANAAEIFSVCQATGFTSADAIRKAGEYKVYYDRRQEHEKIAADKAALESANSELTGKNSELAARLENLNSEYVKLQKDAEEAQRKLNEAKEQCNVFEESLRMFRPAGVDLDKLFAALTSAGEDERAATVVSFSQLYWYAKVSRGNARNIKAVFSKFDTSLYELFEEKPELLEAIRQSLVDAINKQIFGETNYTVQWPLLGSNASEHEDWYNRENDEGNRICKVRSAVVMNNGSVESVARIYTEM